MSELEFEKCLKEIDSGNKNSLKKIYDNYAHSVYSYALYIVKNQHLAEDICQDVFVKVWNNSSKFKNKGKSKSWIMTMTRNTSIDYLRKYKKEDIKEFFDIKEDIDMTDEIHNKITINEAMISLHDDEREIVTLHLISDLTFKNIGEILGKPVGTVTWRYREGIKKLRSKMSL